MRSGDLDEVGLDALHLFGQRLAGLPELGARSERQTSALAQIEIELDLWLGARRPRNDLASVAEMEKGRRATSEIGIGKALEIELDPSILSDGNYQHKRKFYDSDEGQ